MKQTSNEKFSEIEESRWGSIFRTAINAKSRKISSTYSLESQDDIISCRGYELDSQVDKILEKMEKENDDVLRGMKVDDSHQKYDEIADSVEDELIEGLQLELQHEIDKEIISKLMEKHNETRRK